MSGVDVRALQYRLRVVADLIRPLYHKDNVLETAVREIKNIVEDIGEEGTMSYLALKRIEALEDKLEGLEKEIQELRDRLQNTLEIIDGVIDKLQEDREKQDRVVIQLNTITTLVEGLVNKVNERDIILTNGGQGQ